jgi:glucose/arabinose dehydrogenase
LLVGSLRFEYLELLRMDGMQVVGRERLLEDIGRVRSVVRAANGTIYVAVERSGADGFVARVVPSRRP